MTGLPDAKRLVSGGNWVLWVPFLVHIAFQLAGL